MRCSDERRQLYRECRVSVALLLSAKRLSTAQRLCSCGAAMAWLSCVGRLLDGTRPGLAMETARVALVAAWAAAVGVGGWGGAPLLTS